MKKTRNPLWIAGFFGTPSGARTLDTLIKRVEFYGLITIIIKRYS